MSPRAKSGASAIVSKPLDWQSYPYPFIYGQVDHTLFPLAEWRDCARQALGKKWLGSWTNDTWAHDDPLLVEQIRRRILPRRGIMANDDEILVTLGAQNALYLLTTLLAGRGSLLTPIAAPIAYLPVKMIAAPTFGRITSADANYAVYRRHLRRTTEEPFAMFLPG